MNVHMPLVTHHTSRVIRHKPASSKARDVGRGFGGGGASMRRWPHDLDKDKDE
jgi:hypothetical protein